MVTADSTNWTWSRCCRVRCDPTGLPATWSQGDWSGNGALAPLDIIIAGQGGLYLQAERAVRLSEEGPAPIAAARVGLMPDEALAVDAAIQELDVGNACRCGCW